MMKAVHFKSKSNEKFPTNNAKMSKVPRHGKKASKLCTEHFEADTTKRPDSCPVSAIWGSSRNWHEILSGTGDRSKREDSPTTAPINCEKQKFKTQEDDNYNKFKLPDELMNIVLPTVNFCYPQKENDFREDRGPNIVDLCDEEKTKIAQLVQEIAKCKKEKLHDDETIKKLKNEIAELRSTLSTVLAGKNYSESKAVSSLKSRHSNEQAALKKQVAELSTLVVEMQTRRRAADARLQAVLTQAERLTLATRSENERLRLELRLAEDRLAAARTNAEAKVKSFNYEEYSRHLTMEDKACQPSKEIVFENVSDKGYSRPLSTEDKDCQPSTEIIIGKDSTAEKSSALKRHEQKESEDSDQFILKELFFNKSMENDFYPKETIILMMAGCNEQFPPFFNGAKNSDLHN